MSGVQLRATARARIAVRATLCVLVVLPLIVSIATVLSYSSDRDAQRLAAQLLDRGARVVVQDVEVEARGRAWADVRVTFAAGGKTVRPVLRGALPYETDIDDQVGWQAATAASGYGPPLEVAYLPEAPDQVMAVRDLADWADPADLDFGIGVAVGGAVPAVVAGLVWLLRGRPRWWLYLDTVGAPCWLCAHPERDHEKDPALRCAATSRGRSCPCPGYSRPKPRP